LALPIDDRVSILRSVKFNLNRLDNIPVFRRLDHCFLCMMWSVASGSATVYKQHLAYVFTEMQDQVTIHQFVAGNDVEKLKIQGVQRLLTTESQCGGAKNQG